MVKFADAGNKRRYERREWVDRTTSEVIVYDRGCLSNISVLMLEVN